MVLRTVLLVLIWVGWLQYKIFRARSAETQRSAAFWEREQRANFTRKQPLPTEEYIQIPLDKLPFSDTSDPEERELQDTLHALAKEPIFNASGMTNTDIKLTYGTANFPLISKYDQNFLLLQRLLSKWGTLLYNRGDIAKTKTVLEYAISIKTDMKNCYLLLASIYEAEQDYISIKDLIDIVKEQQNNLLQASIIEQLKQKLPG